MALAGGVHVASRGLVLFRLIKGLPIYGLSLVAQELYLVVYLMRYLELLALYLGLADTAWKVAKIGYVQSCLDYIYDLPLTCICSNLLLVVYFMSAGVH